MRAKDAHLAEILSTYDALGDALLRIDATKIDVPSTSYAYHELRRAILNLRKLRTDLWYTRELISQHGYGPLPQV